MKFRNKWLSAKAEKEIKENPFSAKNVRAARQIESETGQPAVIWTEITSTHK